MLDLRSRSRGSAGRSGTAVPILSIFVLGLLGTFLGAPVLRAQSAPKPAADPVNPAVSDLRREIDELKQTYQQRIDELEKRLADLETKSEVKSPAVAAS